MPPALRCSPRAILGYTLMQIGGLLVDRYGASSAWCCSGMARRLRWEVLLLHWRQPGGTFCGTADRCLRRCPGITTRCEARCPKFQRQRRHDVGHLAGVRLCRRRDATTPLAAAVTGFGWRACFVFIACVGVATSPWPRWRSNRIRSHAAQDPGRRLAAGAGDRLRKWRTGMRHSLASHFGRCDDAVGRVGNPMGAFLQHLAVGGEHSAACLHGRQRDRPIFLGHAADRTAALDHRRGSHLPAAHGSDRNAVARPLAHVLGFLTSTVVFAELGLVAGGLCRWC